MLLSTPRIVRLHHTTASTAAATLTSNAIPSPAWLPASSLTCEHKFAASAPAGRLCVCCSAAINSGDTSSERCALHHTPSSNCPCTSSISPSWTALPRSATIRPGPLSPNPLRSLLRRTQTPPFKLNAASAAAFAIAPSPRALSSHTARRRTPTAAAAASETPSTPSSPSPSSFSPSSTRPTLTSGLGQVIASASTYVRVEVHALLPEGAPTPTNWRPAHMRRRRSDTTAAAAAFSSSLIDAGATDPETFGGPESSSDADRLGVTTAAPSVNPAAAAAVAGSSSSSVVEDADGAANAADSEAVTTAGSKLVSAGRPAPVLLCSVRALLRKLRTDVLVGDLVRVGPIDWGQGRGVVSEVLPRSSRLTDPNVANVDHLLLVFALDQPPFEELQVSRFLVAAEAVGLPTRLVLNKADLVEPGEVERRVAQCRSWGYDPVVLSCERGEGVEQVAGVVQGRISAVAGPSGAGKSSLINSLRLGRHRPDLRVDPRVTDPAIFPAVSDPDSSPAFVSSSDSRDYSPASPSLPSSLDPPLIELPPDLVRQYGSGTPTSLDDSGSGSRSPASSEDEEGSGLEFQVVGGLSKIGRGKHTTTTVRLLRLLGGGLLADTPGFGQPDLDNVSSPQLGSCFPEIAALVSERPCRFSDCLHVAEPGCSVSSTGLERYPHYLRFLQEIRTREAGDLRQVQRARAEREGYAKVKSARGGGERLEARLDSKKHRRVSRQSSKQAGRRAEEEM